jgi:hypothetical protein
MLHGSITSHAFISTCYKKGRNINLPDDLFVSLASQGEERELERESYAETQRQLDMVSV